MDHFLSYLARSWEYKGNQYCRCRADSLLGSKCLIDVLSCRGRSWERYWTSRKSDGCPGRETIQRERGRKHRPPDRRHAGLHGERERHADQLGSSFRHDALRAGRHQQTQLAAHLSGTGIHLHLDDNFDFRTLTTILDEAADVGGERLGGKLLGDDENDDLFPYFFSKLNCKYLSSEFSAEVLRRHCSSE